MWENSAIWGAKKVTSIMAPAAPMKEEVKAAVRAWPASPCLAMG